MAFKPQNVVETLLKFISDHLKFGHRSNFKILALLGGFIFGISAHAVNGRTTYQAKIIKPDGNPLEASSVNFRFTIMDPAASCILYVEDYAAVNMSGGGGLISFALGSGIRSFPVSGTSSTFSNVFDNSAAFHNCQPTGTYNPTSIDARKVIMQFQDASGWQTLPAMAINAVPYAMYAGKSDNSIQLNGKLDSAFVEYSTLAGLSCNPATHAIAFNGVSFSCVAVGSGGGGGGITSVTTSGTVLTTGGTASAPVISITAASMSADGYLTSLDYAEFKAKLGASQTQIINALGFAPVSASAVTTQISTALGGVTSSQVLTSLNDTALASSSNVANAIVKRDSSGNSSFSGISASVASVNYVDIYKPSTSFNIRLQAPTSLAANYTLILPTSSGTTGQVLATDGAGTLSWVNPANGSVTSVSATAPLVSTGGATPTISITQATSSTNGYLSSSDFNTFNNKQNATSAAIIATLGYTPADNAASGTYVVKSSNLSDLTNIVTARSNLGLGTFATASSIDLGSASATGIIADARFADQSNVSSGTQYTKVTVDGKGRVVSGAQLSSSDVTTALGYTPATSTTLAASFVQKAGDTMTGQLNLPSNGLAVGTNQLVVSGSNVGIGVLNPTSALQLQAGTTSNAPLKLTSGTLLSSTQSGTIEYDGSQLYFTDGSSIRRALATNSGAGSFDNTSSISNTSGNITLSPNNVTGSVIVNSSAASISSGTGALVVNGGVGIAGSINAGGNLNLTGSATIGQSLTLSSMTSGSMLFAGASGLVSEDNSRLFWDGANKRLGLGTNSPAQTLSVSGTSYFSGNVGIGTSNPVAALDVVGSSVALGILSRSSAPLGGTSGGGLTLLSAHNPTAANQRLGLLSFGAVKDNGDIGYASTVVGYSTAAWTSGTTGGSSLGFETSVGGGGRFERMRINDNGNIGVASSTPGSRLVVKGAGTTSATSALNITNSSNASLMYVGNDGDVGIGTATPGAQLEVANGDIKIGTSGKGIGLTPNSSTMPRDITWDSTGTLIRDTGYVDFVADSNGDASGGFRFYASGTTRGSATPLVTIGLSGNVGIGTTAPTSNLSVQAVSGASIKITNTNGRTVGDKVSLKFAIDSAENTVASIYSDNTGGGNGASAIGFSTWDGSTTSEKMRISASGNIGIGTSSPTNANGWGRVLDVFAPNHSKIIASQNTAGVSVATGIFSHGLTGNGYGGYPVSHGGVGFVGTESNHDLGVMTNNIVKLSITKEGKVGIGATSPGAKLHIVNNNDYTGTILLGNSPYQGKVDFSGGTGLFQLDNTSAGVSASVYYQFKADGIPVMSIRKDGNVGIGTTSPNQRLHVSGNGAGAGNQTGIQIGDVGSAAGPLFLVHNNPTVAGNAYYNNTWLYGGGSSRPSSIDFSNGLSFVTSNNSVGSAGTTVTDFTTKMYISPIGNVGIGTTTPGYKLDVSGTINIASGSALAFGGTSVCTAAGCTSSSDERLKENIKPLDFDLNKLLSLNAVQYDWKNKSKYGDKHQIGFIAQNLEQVYPEVVYTDKNTGLKSVTYGHLVAPIIEALKSIYNRLLGLETRIDRQIASIVESKADKAQTEEKIKQLEVKAAEVDAVKAENAELKNENSAIKAYLCSKDPNASICK